MDNKPTVFISYSHQDEAWKNRLLPQLRVLEQAGRVSVWQDRQIDPGGEWFNQIEGIMNQAAVSVCLISPDYLASNFCTKEEIPYLLTRREYGMTLIPILLRPCAWRAFDWLKKLQMIPRDGRSIAEDFQGREDGVFAQVAEQILNIVDDPAYRPPAPPPPVWSLPDKIDIDRLPQTGVELFGRQSELTLLDLVWAEEQTHIISLVAWGGVGKSTLVNHWLQQMAADNYRGARRVFGWSFYSQGTNERVTSADVFMAAALAWFGDPDPSAGSPWDKGQRLAELVAQQKTLLLLDGLEPLQAGLAVERGQVKDPALAMLLAGLARRNPGLCVITTREPVADLAAYPETTYQENLEQISAEAGRALLRIGRVQGADAELEAAARAFGGHALALNLLTAFLHDLPGHPIAAATAIPDLPDVPVEAGKHPRRVMAALAGRFGPGPERNVLRLLGLFDRPAEADALAALLAPPPIPDLTDALVQSTDAHRFTQMDKNIKKDLLSSKLSVSSVLSVDSNPAWLNAVDHLRQAQLLAPTSSHRPGALDAHPLVREHFAAELRQTYPAAWRAGHNRLYEHYKAAAPELPDTLEEMAPLFAAVGHGCQAGRHQEALDEVYFRRIQRGGRINFCTSRLGAVSSDLAALSSFFDPPWGQPAARLTEASKTSILSLAGFHLLMLGRLDEAVQPMQAALETRIAQENWANAAKVASNLSELALTGGDLPGALIYAQESVELASRSGDAFMRMYSRTTLADTLHQAGRFTEAATAFTEAEVLQKGYSTSTPLLYSFQGFRYCDLLLSLGEAGEVQRRAGQTLEIAKKYVGQGLGLLDIGLDYLSLGRAYLADGQSTANRQRAAVYLNQAVDGLRQAGTQDILPLGLLARAELHRAQGHLGRAQADIDEAMSIATRGGMRLHEADCHLAYARLYLAAAQAQDLWGFENPIGLAARHLDTARQMINAMGYHRRDAEVKELAAALEAAR